MKKDALLALGYVGLGMFVVIILIGGMFVFMDQPIVHKDKITQSGNTFVCYYGDMPVKVHELVYIVLADKRTGYTQFHTTDGKYFFRVIPIEERGKYIKGDWISLTWWEVL